MIGWLRRLLTGEPCCDHEYETTDTHEIQRDNRTTKGFLYILRCKKCGWICHRKVVV